MGHKILYYNAGLITGRAEEPFLPGGYLLVDGDRIAAVGVCAEEALPAADVRKNLCGRIVMPGMISAHCHFYGQFVRGMPLRQPVANWQQVLSRMWWRLDKALDEQQVYYSAVMGLIEGLKAGTTTYFDHQASPNYIEGSLDTIERALRTVGGRGCLAYEVTDRDGQARAMQGIEENARYIKKHAGENDRFKGIFGLHASYTLSDETLACCSGVGNTLSSGFHIHMAEAEADVSDCYRRYDMHVTERLAKYNILGEKTITAHNVHLRAPQIELLRSSGTTAAHNCQSNTNNAVGICPVCDMMDAGVRVALGGDGYSYDMFSELGFASILQHLRAMDCAAFPAKQVWDMAFTNNQRLARNIFGYDVGQLRAGAAADFLILDYDPPTPLNADNLLSHMTGGFSGHVHTVFVNGECVVENHRCTKFDEAQAAAACRAQARRLWDSLDAEA
jgi:putative selenium metabolism protein SsnA